MPGVLFWRAQAVTEPSQGHLVVRRHVLQCRSLAVRSVTMLPGGNCRWTWAALGDAMGF